MKDMVNLRNFLNRATWAWTLLKRQITNESDLANKPNQGLGL